MSVSRRPEEVEMRIGGKARACPMCGGKRFLTRTTMLNTRGFTFFGLDWANRDAANYICTGCGHILWFIPGVEPPEDPKMDIV